MAAPLLLLLEDDPNRVRLMTQCVKVRLPKWEIRVSSNVADAEVLCEFRWPNLRLASLDHDLDLDPAGATDADGRAFAEWLADRAPAFPLILHSSNGAGAQSMSDTLTQSGWQVTRVVPIGTEWIQRDWIAAVASLARQSP